MPCKKAGVEYQRVKFAQIRDWKLMIRAIIFDMGGTLLDIGPEHIPWPEWERAEMESVCEYLSWRGYAILAEAFAV
jgi:hypothetical protein